MMLSDDTGRAFDAARHELDRVYHAVLAEFDAKYPPAWPTEEPKDTMPNNDSLPPVVWISETTSRMGSKVERRTPPDVASAGLGGLLDRLDAKLRSPVGVVLLAGELPAMLDLPGTQPPKKPGPAVPTAVARGWSISFDEDGREQPWMLAIRNNRVIAVGVLPWLQPHMFSLNTPDVDRLMWRMEAWHNMFGVPYYGQNGGLCGLAMIRDHTITPKMKRDNRPLFKPTNWHRIEPADQGGTELPDNWISPVKHSFRFEHQYDLSTQHLSAFGVVQLAPGMLHRDATPRDPIMTNPPGYYLITVPKLWKLADQIPHPCGTKPVGEKVWITAPTLDLIMECAERHSLIDIPEVHESWTARKEDGSVHPGTRVLRKWSATVVDAIKLAHVMGQVDPENAVMLRAAKNLYKATRGMMHRSSSRVTRPDWAHAIVAMARCNLWRKIYTEGRKTGRWPVQVYADAVWYASDQPDAVMAAPETFKLDDGTGVQGGTFTVETSREVPPRD